MVQTPLSRYTLVGVNWQNSHMYWRELACSCMRSLQICACMPASCIAILLLPVPVVGDLPPFLSLLYTLSICHTNTLLKLLGVAVHSRRWFCMASGCSGARSLSIVQRSEVSVSRRLEIYYTYGDNSPWPVSVVRRLTTSRSVWY